MDMIEERPSVETMSTTFNTLFGMALSQTQLSNSSGLETWIGKDLIIENLNKEVERQRKKIEDLTNQLSETTKSSHKHSIISFKKDCENCGKYITLLQQKQSLIDDMLYSEKQNSINLHKLKIESEMQRNEIDRLLRHLYDEQNLHIEQKVTQQRMERYNKENMQKNQNNSECCLRMRLIRSIYQTLECRNKTDTREMILVKHNLLAKLIGIIDSQ